VGRGPAGRPVERAAAAGVELRRTLAGTDADVVRDRVGYRVDVELDVEATRLGSPQLVAAGLEGLARIAAADGSPEALVEARALLAQADAVREHGGRPRAPYERAELAGLTDQLAGQV
jgi:hypothetical protein